MRDNWLFVSAAFVLTWAMLIGYFVRLQRLLQRARAALAGTSATETR